MRRSTLLFLLATWCLTIPSSAQDITASLVGRVTDPSGAAIPGATILVHNEGTGADVKQTADATGNYTVPNLFAGQYSITVQKQGFAATQFQHVALRASQVLRQDVPLKPGGATQTVEVHATGGMIHTDSQMIGSSLGATQLENLPIAARSIDSLIQLAPGVSTTGSNPRISGSNYWGGTNYTLNGVSVNDAGNGGGAYTSGVSWAAPSHRQPQPVRHRRRRTDRAQPRILLCSLPRHPTGHFGGHQPHHAFGGHAYRRLLGSLLRFQLRPLHLRHAALQPLHRRSFPQQPDHAQPHHLAGQDTIDLPAGAYCSPL